MNRSKVTIRLRGYPLWVSYNDNRKTKAYSGLLEPFELIHFRHPDALRPAQHAIARRFAVCHVLLVHVLSFSVAAARAGEEPESPYLDDNLPVVLSMTRMPQRIDDAPGSVTLFTREDIERLGYRRLPQLLRTVPGMNVINDTGHSPGLFYHGLGSLTPNRMQVLIDGRSVYSPYLFGYVDWDALPVTMDEIERIEVVRGSNAATYGSNAVAGVVNIVTRSSNEGPAAIVEVGRGNHDVADVSMRLRHSFGPLGLAVNTRSMGDNGFSERYDDSRLNATTLRADLALNGSDEVSLTFGESRGWRGVGYPLGVVGNSDNGNGFRDVSTENTFVHLRFRRLVATDNEWSVSYYRNEDKGREEWFGDATTTLKALHLPVTPLVLPIDYNRKSIRQNLEFQHQFVPVPDWRLAWGAELRRDELISDRMFYLSGRESQGLVRISANLEWRPSESWTFNLGDMIERFQGEDPLMSPRLFATWHVTPQHAIKAGVSRAYRQPSLVEERGDSRFVFPQLTAYLAHFNPALAAAIFPGGNVSRTFVGDPSLSPERLDSMELGYVGQFGRSTLDVRVFHETYNHLVGTQSYHDPAFPNGGITFVKGDGATISGIEYQYRYRGDGREIWFSQALPHISSNDACTAKDGCIKDSVPSSTWSLTWMEALPQDWSVSATLFGVGHARWRDNSKRIDDYHSLDARLAKKFRYGDMLWEAALALTDQGSGYETFNDNQGSRLPFNPVARQARFTLRASWF